MLGDNQSLILFLSSFNRPQNDEPDRNTKSDPSLRGANCGDRHYQQNDEVLL